MTPQGCAGRGFRRPAEEGKLNASPIHSEGIHSASKMRPKTSVALLRQACALPYFQPGQAIGQAILESDSESDSEI